MFFAIMLAPIIVITGFITTVALIKKHASDKFNSKISTNLKEYEKDMNDRYKL